MKTEKLIKYTDEDIEAIIDENYKLKVQMQQSVYDLGVLQHTLLKQKRGSIVYHIIYITLIVFILVMWRLQG